MLRAFRTGGDHARSCRRNGHRRRAFRISSGPLRTLRQPEIEHLHRSIRRDLDVGRLQIAMDDSLRVCDLEGRGDLPRDLQNFIEGEWTPRESLDPGRLELRGNPIPVLDDVDGNVIAGNGRFDFSLTGTFIYLSGNTLGSPSSLVWMDASGKTENVMPPRATMSPRVSPDAHYSITGKLGEGGMGAGRQLDRISRGWRWQARQDRGAGRRAGRAVRRRLRNGSELDRRRPYRLRAWQPQRSGQDLRFGLRRAKMLRVPAGAIAGGRGGRQRVGSR